MPDRDRRLARVDLYWPVAISRTEILMTGTAAGRPFFDIYLLRLGEDVPVNLTRTPDVHEGDLCVRAGPGIVAYRAGDREVFARVRGGSLEPLAAPPVRGLVESPGPTTGGWSACPGASLRSRWWSARSATRSSVASAPAPWTGLRA